MNRPLYLIDGSNLAFRSQAVSTGKLTLGDVQVGAIYGTLKTVFSFLKDFQPGKVVFAFDLEKSKYRKELYPDYKGHRKDNKVLQEYAKAVHEQVPALIDILELAGFTVFGEKTRGIEADDVIAYCASKVSAKVFQEENDFSKAIIISTDRDYIGLIQHDAIAAYNPMSKKIFQLPYFQQELGIAPHQWVDYKSLIGDESDNIKHPVGIGPAKAAKLLQQYGTLEKMAEANVGGIPENWDMLELNRKLVHLNLHYVQPQLPCWKKIEEELEQKREISVDFKETLKALEFNSLLDNWDDLEEKLKQFVYE